MAPSSQICPWCDMEIIWDPETGPEDLCPYCSNELKDYRTIRLQIERDPDIGDDDTDDNTRETDIRNGKLDDLDDLDFDGNGFDDTDDGGDNEDDDDADLDDFDEAEQDELEAYDAMVERLREEQDVTPECETCREDMLYIGDYEFSASHFKPVIPKALGEPVISGDFSVHIYTCPVCFRVRHILSEDDRLAVMEKLKQSARQSEEAR